MSNFFAIATVTAAISHVLQAIKQDVDGALTTTKPLDVANSDPPSNRLNIFLYRVTPNVAYRNADLPTYNFQGDIVKSPKVAVDLHYILTAYGAQNDEIMAQQILASAMRIMEENAILTKKIIEQTVDTTNKLSVGEEKKSDLAKQIENIRLSMSNISMEELSNIWSSSQTNYRLSIGYVATVVIVESTKPTKPAPTVSQRNLYVVPIAEPFIEAVKPQIIEYGNVDAKISIAGRNLKSDVVRIYFDNTVYEPGEMDVIEPNTITIKEMPQGLPLGLRKVKVVQPMLIGSPPTEHETAFSSNMVPFILCPSDVSLSSAEVRPGEEITVTFAPPAKPSDEVAVLIGGRVIAVPKRPEDSNPINQVTIRIPNDMKPDRYVVRVRINGIDSLTKPDENPESPTRGQFVLPGVEVKS